MFKLLFFLVFTLFLIEDVFSVVHMEPHFSVTVGDSDQTETSSRTFEHDATALGLEFGGRIGLNLFGFAFGGLGGINWSHMEASRAPGGNLITGESGYDQTLENQYWGGFLGYMSEKSPLRIWGEYYKEVHGTFTYADPEAVNPFSHRDKLKGDGFGIGLGFKRDSYILSVVYRLLEYDRASYAGAWTNLPNATYNEYKLNQISFQFSISL